MKSLLSAIVVAVVLTTLTGCEDGDGFTVGKYKFVNNSSYDVTVSPNGQSSWSRFVIGPGQDRTVNINETHIYFLYSPSNRVQADTSEEGRIVFTNR